MFPNIKINHTIALTTFAFTFTAKYRSQTPPKTGCVQNRSSWYNNLEHSIFFAIFLQSFYLQGRSSLLYLPFFEVDYSFMYLCLSMFPWFYNFMVAFCLQWNCTFDHLIANWLFDLHYLPDTVVRDFGLFLLLLRYWQTFLCNKYMHSLLYQPIIFRIWSRKKI